MKNIQIVDDVSAFKNSPIIEQHTMNVGDRQRITAIEFDDHNEPISVASTILFPSLMIHCVKITGTCGSEILPLLCRHLEKMGYYKFQMVAPEQMLIKFESKILDRYNWYDEARLTEDKPRFPLHSVNLIRQPDISSVVRIYILKQEWRVEYFRNMNHTDYIGTLIQDVLELSEKV